MGAWRKAAPVLAAGVLAVTVAACSSSGGGSSASAPPSAGSSASAASGTLKLGYFPNLTHAPALYGTTQGIFAKDLGPGVTLKQSTFNSGTQEAEAILSGAIDAGYIGPNPAVNAYIKTKGAVLRIVSGATSGGAGLVVKPSITSVADLKGKKIATPGLANTQDVALRYYLQKNGLKTSTSGGGDIQVLPQDNAVTATAFASGAIDGAWVPEPYLSRLVAEGGKVLVDEASQWPGGKFVTTLLVVRTDYLTKNPEIVKRLIQGNVDSINALNADPRKGQDATNAALKKLSGKALASGVITSAWKRLTFTPDPIASSLTTSAAHQASLGLLKGKTSDLNGIFDLSVLNGILSSSGKAQVASQ
jgi:NitT/TauT family transport system substrate-binding protein